MADPITVRRATAADVETIARFNEAMAAETEDKPLDGDTVRAGVRAVFDGDKGAFYLVAEREGEVVGSLMITTEWSDWRNADFWWIQSVYVRPADRRTGVYRTLHEEVRQRATEKTDVCGLRLYVETENEPAQRAYEAMGMHQPSYEMYEETL